jgi:polar amino acid transport system substrate-binding protein
MMNNWKNWCEMRLGLEASSSVTHSGSGLLKPGSPKLFVGIERVARRFSVALCTQLEERIQAFFRRRFFASAIMAAALAIGAYPVHAGAIFDHVIKAGAIRIGVPYNLMPQGFVTNEGEWVGFEVDLANELARHMNLKLDKVKITDKTWPAVLSKGQIDAALCRIPHTRHLDSQFDFSEPYFYDSLNILAVKGSFKSPEDLKGSKLAAVQGSAAEKVAMRLLRAAGDTRAEANVVSFPDRPNCFLALTKDKVAGWVDSGVLLLEYASKTSGKFDLIPASENVEAIAVALPQNDSAWRDLVNFTIQDMVSDGSFKKIYEKWFGPGTPYSFPLKRPLDVWPE